jgi:hypothetical protein
MTDRTNAEVADHYKPPSDDDGAEYDPELEAMLQ